MIARVLDPSEWGKLEVTGNEPMHAYVPEEKMSVVVVEDEGAIVGTITIMQVTHLESAWISPSYRGNAGVVSKLLKATFEESRKVSGGWVMCQSTSDSWSDILKRLGGVKIPVETFIIGKG